jgi:hypothetical protein
LGTCGHLTAQTSYTSVGKGWFPEHLGPGSWLVVAEPLVHRIVALGTRTQRNLMIKPKQTILPPRLHPPKSEELKRERDETTRLKNRLVIFPF